MHTNNYTDQNSFRQVFCEEYNKNIGLVLGYLLKFSARYQDIFVSQARISENTGLSIRTVGSVIKRLRELQFIITKRRYNKTLIYIINPFFFSFRTMMETYFPFLRTWSKKLFKKVSSEFCRLVSCLLFIKKNNMYDDSGKEQNSRKVTPQNTAIVNKGPRSVGDYLFQGLNYAKGISKKVNQYLKPQKKEDILMAPPTPMIKSSALEEISLLLNMNDVQAAHFYCIPDVALRHFSAQARASGRHNVPDFKVFFDHAVNYCNQNGLSIDRITLKQVSSRYGDIDQEQTKPSVTTKPSTNQQKIEELKNDPVKARKYARTVLTGGLDPEKIEMIKQSDPFYAELLSLHA